MPKLVMKMPDLATTDSTIKVIRWFVAVDQPVTRGQALLEVETDKATMEVESIATGRLLGQLAQPGDALISGQPLASLEVEGLARPPSAASPTVAGVADPGLPAETSTKAGPGSTSPATTNPPPPTPPPAPKAGGMFARNRANQPNTPPPKP